jgi:hypothetical protein
LEDAVIMTLSALQTRDATTESDYLVYTSLSQTDGNMKS